MSRIALKCWFHWFAVILAALALLAAGAPTANSGNAYGQPCMFRATPLASIGLSQVTCQLPQGRDYFTFSGVSNVPGYRLHWRVLNANGAAMFWAPATTSLDGLMLISVNPRSRPHFAKRLAVCKGCYLQLLLVPPAGTRDAVVYGFGIYTGHAQGRSTLLFTSRSVPQPATTRI